VINGQKTMLVKKNQILRYLCLYNFSYDSQNLYLNNVIKTRIKNIVSVCDNKVNLIVVCYWINVIGIKTFSPLSFNCMLLLATQQPAIHCFTTCKPAGIVSSFFADHHHVTVLLR
jgi:hypothetical protein